MGNLWATRTLRVKLQRSHTVPIELRWWEIYGTYLTSLSAGMGNLWNNTVCIFHTITIDKEDWGNVSLLWDMYGECIPIARPYNGKHQVFFPYTSHSLKCVKIYAHSSSTSSSNLPIPFPHMGQIWPKLSHIITILLLW